MKIMIITDAWDPQVNGVVRTLKQTRAELTAMGHEVEMITPTGFKSIPCPTYPDIALSLFPGKEVARRIKELRIYPDDACLHSLNQLLASKQKDPVQVQYH